MKNIFTRQYIRLFFQATLTISLTIFLIRILTPIFHQWNHAYHACRIGCSVTKVGEAPWFYHGRKISVVGFIKLKFEGNAVYPSEEFAKYNLVGDSIWLEVNDEVEIKKDKYNLKFVEIHGRFNATKHGHGDLFLGTLEDIEEINVSPDSFLYFDYLQCLQGDC